jgi:tetrahydrodipicolinate N-succinyltransferase
MWGRKSDNVPQRQVDSRFHRLRLIASGPVVGGPPGRVKVSPTAKLGNVVINTMSGNVVIGDHCFFGQEAMLLTGTHDFTATGAERQERIPDSGRDIIIEDGAWIASRAIIIGPCRIGANAVVCCGCVIDFDVPPDTIVRAHQDLRLEPIRFRDRSELLRSIS